VKTYLEAWIAVATALLSQALAGEPELNESLPKPMAAGAFGFCATLSGDLTGRFVVILDPELLNASLVGDGVDQKAGWSEILREVAEAAAGELLAKAGVRCKIEMFTETAPESQVSRAFQLRANERAWTLLVRDDVRPASAPQPQPSASANQEAASKSAPSAAPPAPETPAGLRPGTELLLDVELEASLRFGCREINLGQLLDLGPGDVVELDRHISDPVDLVVGDKIVARGEVVLVNGDFGLRVTEVSTPRKRLESIRCLF
jgi:flagellar motor switch protein FliN